MLRGCNVGGKTKRTHSCGHRYYVNLFPKRVFGSLIATRLLCGFNREIRLFTQHNLPIESVNDEIQRRQEKEKKNYNLI